MTTWNGVSGDVDVDVVVVGCGPVGATAANLFGRAGLSVLVLERDLKPVDIPRAIHFDASVMRIFQAAGLAAGVATRCRVIDSLATYGADGQLLSVSSAGTGTDGWEAHYNFFQPELEETLRDALAKLPEVELRLGAEVREVDQEGKACTVRWHEHHTINDHQIRSRFVVATDGATSTIRRKIGIRLEDLDFDEPWLVVDALVEGNHSLPASTSQMFCNPRRPTTLVPGPGSHRRWEFMLLPGEEPQEMAEESNVRRLLQPYVSLGSTQVLRASIYRFHALIAETWRDGNVLLAGDAVHQTPPFLGQGMCHGIRDVQAIAWRLRVIKDGGSSSVLASYQSEREPQVREIIGQAVRKGREICLLDPALAAERDRAATGGSSRWSKALDSTLRLSVDHGLIHPDRSKGIGVIPQALDDGSMLDDQLPPGFVAVESALGDGPALTLGDATRPLAAVASLRGQAARRWFAGARWVVLRPDRHPYGFAEDADGLDQLVAHLGRDLGIEPETCANRWAARPRTSHRARE